MGRVRVADLAKKMEIPEGDLVHKLRSIGVRIEGENAHIDTEVIQAILSGKRPPPPAKSSGRPARTRLDSHSTRGRSESDVAKQKHE